MKIYLGYSSEVIKLAKKYGEPIRPIFSLYHIQHGTWKPVWNEAIKINKESANGNSRILQHKQKDSK